MGEHERLAQTLLLRWRKHICAETRAPGHSGWGTQLPSSKRPHISCPSQLVSKQQVTILDVNLEVAQFYQCVGNGFYAIADVDRKFIFQDDSGMYWFSYKLLSKARKSCGNFQPVQVPNTLFFKYILIWQLNSLFVIRKCILVYINLIAIYILIWSKIVDYI